MTLFYDNETSCFIILSYLLLLTFYFNRLVKLKIGRNWNFIQFGLSLFFNLNSNVHSFKRQPKFH